jgi:hypothetical protein
MNRLSFTACSRRRVTGFTTRSVMPWKCPACQTQIAHDGDRPVPRRIYRCHVCRLELVLDEVAGKLTVTPFPIEHNRRATDPKPSTPSHLATAPRVTQSAAIRINAARGNRCAETHASHAVTPTERSAFRHFTIYNFLS